MDKFEKMSEGTELRKCAGRDIVQEMIRNSENCERLCKERQENCEKKCKEMKEHCDRERREMQNLIKELLKRNNIRRNDLPESFQIQEGSRCFDQPQKIATSSASSINGSGEDNQGFTSTTKSGQEIDQISRDRGSNHLVDISLGMALVLT